MNPSDSDKSPAKDEFEQVVDKLRSASNILVTVNTDPTVDQFAACIGLTLILNKLNKHCNAVFSGKVPSTLAFLKPEETIEKDTNSLRDFIIALDKAKADKLRYKVEDDVVKIFITPYKTSISEDDLKFSQGDFNVDAIVALGVQDKSHIDEAILAHGRILHDATVISINNDKHSRIGSLNWTDNRASSLCEMVADVAMELDSKIFDNQNATALLTGIVSETDRYSNEKAAPHTMSVAGLLMSAGASTQLVSSKLQEGEVNHSIADSDSKGEDGDGGLLEIEHDAKEEQQPKAEETEKPTEETDENEVSSSIKPLSEEEAQAILEGSFANADSEQNEPPETPAKPRIMHSPPEFSGQLTANAEPEENQYSGSTDPLSNLPEKPLISRSEEDEAPSTDTLIPPSDETPSGKGKDLSAVDDKQTLAEIEKAVDSPHQDDGIVVGSTADNNSNLETARDAVIEAEEKADAENPRPEARQDIGSTELGSDLNENIISPESATLDPSANPNSSKDTPPPPVPPPYMPPAA